MRKSRFERLCFKKCDELLFTTRAHKRHVHRLDRAPARKIGNHIDLMNDCDRTLDKTETGASCPRTLKISDPRFNSIRIDARDAFGIYTKFCGKGANDFLKVDGLLDRADELDH